MTFNCRFCINLGITTTKHSIKSCPELAKTECRYCHELGHTVSKCPKLAEKQRKPKSDRRAFIRGNTTAAPKPTSMTMVDMIAPKLPKDPSPEKNPYKGVFKNLEDVDLSTPVEQGLKATKPIAAKGAWAAGRPKTVEVRPHQELRPNTEIKPIAKPKADHKPKAEIKPKADHKPSVYMSTQNTGGNYAAEEELREKAAKQGLTCWADDDEEMDPNDPFFN